MAEKHKSKYKAPKDLEKSQKPTPRKDLKDYTAEDKDEKMNPNSTGEKQKNVLRKTDKEVIDNGSLVPDLKDADRAYKPDGEHDPKHAAKVMSKRQDDDEKDNKENIKDKIENLTREQKERLVREMIRRRIKAVLKEQSFSSDITHVDDELKRAMEEAQRISKEEGVAQHVNHIGKGRFDVSDWYDSDNTVVSFENGRKINESIKEQEDSAPEEDVPTEEPAPEAPAPEAPAPAPAEAPAPAPAEEPAPEAPAEEPKADAAPEQDSTAQLNSFVALVKNQPTSPEQVKMILKAVQKVGTSTDDEGNEVLNSGKLKEMYRYLKMAADRMLEKYS